ncbi:hypothetical protein [Desulfovibrio ferrophilus]|uniref:Fimbrial assembly family protein n=1 Tax=Desulfovibrio ferrophilus TaxID=241368 RepID=A0A2Z6AZD7_9BACT|nr:hypothetical protein [Desulfovibrio ferrophilus]BBD08516.1 uncharacterized protein DFE_1790 [Desulfovibrio ferrophilus]
MSPSISSSSTEKLLKAIKGKNDGAIPGKQTGSKSFSQSGFRLGQKRRSGNSAAIGVDIAPDSLRLVRIERTDQGPRLSGFWSVPFETGVTPDSPGFAAFLTNQIKKFRGSDKQAQIWSLVSTAQAEMWHVRVPKVPKSKLSEAVYWTAMKEKSFDANSMVMDYEIQGEVMDKGVPKIQALVYVVPKEVLDKAKTLFAAASIKLAGVTISPIALQSLFRSELISGCDEVCAAIYIGRNWSRIDLFSEGDLVLSRGVNTGTSSLVSELADAYNRRLTTPPEPEAAAPAEIEAPSPIELEIEIDETPATAEAPEPVFELEYQFEIDAADTTSPAPTESEAAPSAEPEPAPAATPKQPSAPIDEEQAHALLLGILLNREIPAGTPGADLSAEALIDLAGPAMSRLVRQIERTFGHHMNSLNGAPVQKIFFSGDLCTNRHFLDVLSAQLGIECVLLDPLGTLGTKPGAPSVPDESSSRLEFNLVCGLALCDSDATPNLLHTYKDKDKDRQIIHQGNLVYGVFLALVLVLAATWLWQQNTQKDLQTELDNYQTVLASFSPQVDEPLLLTMATRVGKQQKRLKDLSTKYEGLAAITELGNLTPEGVRLISMGLELGAPPMSKPDPDEKKKSKPTIESPKIMVLDGVVQGAPEMFDAKLATYLARLQHSPLFSSPVVHKREVERLGARGDVLRFILHINMS